MICYVSAFLDIQRDTWKNFGRSFNTYLEHFSPLYEMFKASDMFTQKDINKNILVLFLDEKRLLEYQTRFPIVDAPRNIHVIPINEDFMFKNSVLWSRIERERCVLESEKYKKEFQNRLSYPENSNEKYTLINHAKIDFLCTASKIFKEYDNFCWVDFGYFQNKDRIPKSFLDITKFPKDKITYTLIDRLDENDKNVMYTMHNAPERIGGFFFFGNRYAIHEYQKLYHYIHEWFQNNDLVDDDQHLALRCYYNKPELFNLVYCGGWHKALIAFQSL
jgi:hypothetical protein